MEKIAPNANLLDDISETDEEFIEQKHPFQKSQTRASQRLKNRQHARWKGGFDMNANVGNLSGAELEMTEEANFEKAIQNNLDDDQQQSVCDICIAPVSCSDDLIAHEGIRVCKECFAMLKSSSDDEVEYLYAETETPGQEIKESRSSKRLENNKKTKRNVQKESVGLTHGKNNAKKIKENTQGDCTIIQSAINMDRTEQNTLRSNTQDVNTKNKAKKKAQRVNISSQGLNNEARAEETVLRGKLKPIIIRRGECDLNKPFKCPHCPKRFELKASMTRHIKSIHEVKHPHKCSYCDKTFYRTDQKRYHEMQHTGEMPFKCQFCNKAFAMKHSMRAHEMRHTNDGPHKCIYCGKGFAYICNVKAHEVIHTGEKPFKCQYCGKSFPYKNSKKIHEMIHTGEKPYKCNYCDARFRTKEYRKSHEMVHTDTRPLECDFCDKRFRSHECKRDHERSHTGEEPFECKFCDKRFRHRHAKTLHERLHTGEKPYKCNYCDKTFRRGGKRNDHERRRHTGEKPFQCGF